MEKTKRNSFEKGLRVPVAVGLRPLGTRAANNRPEDEVGELRQAALTLALALYPLVGSLTIVLAAIMLASGANSG